MHSSLSALRPLEKKFRFDSFATEFACKENISDTDSGFDSEAQISPPLERPLSLVLREQCPPVRHWKKSLKDQAHRDLISPLGKSSSLTLCALPLKENNNSYLNTNTSHLNNNNSHVNINSSHLNNNNSQCQSESLRASHVFFSTRCKGCKAHFSSSSSLKTHESLGCSSSSSSLEKSSSLFSCRYCSKGYNSLSALKMHIRTHTLPNQCTICGKSFSRPWLLQGHVRTHTGEKPYGCTYCDRAFADKSNLRAHLQTHLQTKKYSCVGCQKTFSRMSLLNKHTESGCVSLSLRTNEAVESLMGLSTSGIRT